MALTFLLGFLGGYSSEESPPCGEVKSVYLTTGGDISCYDFTWPPGGD